MTIFAERMRQMRARRKAAGLCIGCGAARDTETLCYTCADKKRRTTGPITMRVKKRYPLQRKPKEK